MRSASDARAPLPACPCPSCCPPWCRNRQATGRTGGPTCERVPPDKATDEAIGALAALEHELSTSRERGGGRYPVTAIDGRRGEFPAGLRGRLLGSVCGGVTVAFERMPDTAFLDDLIDDKEQSTLLKALAKGHPLDQDQPTRLIEMIEPQSWPTSDTSHGSGAAGAQTLQNP